MRKEISYHQLLLLYPESGLEGVLLARSALPGMGGEGLVMKKLVMGREIVAWAKEWWISSCKGDYLFLCGPLICLFVCFWSSYYPLFFVKSFIFNAFQASLRCIAADIFKKPCVYSVLEWSGKQCLPRPGVVMAINDPWGPHRLLSLPASLYSAHLGKPGASLLI